MTQNVLAPEVAQAEVQRWLDFKRINEKKREEKKESIESLVSYFEDGTLELQEDYTIKQTLKFPIGANEAVKELTFKPRLTVKEINNAKNKNAKGFDTDSYITDRMAALTGVNRELLLNLDTVDAGVCNTIVVFFV